MAELSQPDVGSIEQADYLVRAAVDFMVDLYPIAEAHVSYREKENVPDYAGDGKARRGALFPTHRDVRAVPTRPNCQRRLNLTLNDDISRFVGEDASTYLEVAFDRLTIAMDLAHAWTEQLGPSSHKETREAVQSALPTHILAHVIADRYARMTGEDTFQFAHHRDDGEHDTLADTIVESLEYMDALTRSRVEDQDLSHGVVIVSSDKGAPPVSPGRYPRDFQPLKRTPLLADGYQSALLLTTDGRAASLLTPDHLPSLSDDSRHDFGSLGFLARSSARYEGIGLMLRPGGSLVTFAGERPLYIRRSGQWRDMMWDLIRNVMVERYGDVGAKVFDTALILTTSGRGGILAVMEEVDPKGINDKDRVDLAQAVSSDDAEDREMPPEWLFHRLLSTDSIAGMSSRSLAQLAGIDGATIVSEDGNLLAYGAIVSSVQGRSEGARTAAARTLSEQGLVLRISEDGPIQLFEQGNSLLTV
jgi:hypothetical protein